MDLTKPTPISIARNDNALPEPVLVCEQRASRSDATPDTWNGICMASARMAFWQHLHNFSRTWFSREKQLRHHQVLHFDAFISIKIPSDTEKSASQKGDTQSFQVTKISGIILESHICCYLLVLRCYLQGASAFAGVWRHLSYSTLDTKIMDQAGMESEIEL